MWCVPHLEESRLKVLHSLILPVLLAGYSLRRTVEEHGEGGTSMNSLSSLGAVSKELRQYIHGFFLSLLPIHDSQLIVSLFFSLLIFFPLLPPARMGT